ncbi:MAG: nuclease-related domain-containing protein [Streptosporangiaceae bacterium]
MSFEVRRSSERPGTGAAEVGDGHGDSTATRRRATGPRTRAWLWRGAIALAVFLGVQFWLDWRYALTAAVFYLAADVVFRSRTMAVVQPETQVTSAQRYTRRRLAVLNAAGYVALHSRVIPGRDSIIDHLVVGPAGIFAIDSEKWDRRLPLRAIGGMLYHGPHSMEARLAHARDEAHWGAELIGRALGRQLRVHPVMVIYGPEVAWSVMKVKGVDVIAGGHVNGYFRKLSKATVRHHLSTEQISALITAAERALPPLDQS